MKKICISILIFVVFVVSLQGSEKTSIAIFDGKRLKTASYCALLPTLSLIHAMSKSKYYKTLRQETGSLNYLKRIGKRGAGIYTLLSVFFYVPIVIGNQIIGNERD